MDLVSFNVVYVDRRAHRDRVERRSEPGISEELMGSSVSHNSANGVEHHEVDENIRTLLATFTTGKFCLRGSPSTIKSVAKVMLTLVLSSPCLHIRTSLFVYTFRYRLESHTRFV